ncbi:MAG: tRNA pseudouridine(55) synthase TruB, partial [Alphaproteobacteria bacterium]|nr:tRNA pseudouridine(55) synthase TruB [Alphaproteobacteria bacterium]
QIPPKFSAIKINGNRAYDLARDGEEIELQARTVEIDELSIVDAADPDLTTFSAICGKGTYVRSLARDLGRELGCFGHIADLRRTRVGPFKTEIAVTFEELEEALDRDIEAGEGTNAARDALLLPVEAALDGIEHLNVSSADAARLVRGQPVLMRGRDAPVYVGTAYATSRGKLIALVDCDRGTLRPTRVFNLGS